MNVMLMVSLLSRFITRYIKCFPEFSWPGVKQKLFAFQLLNSVFAQAIRQKRRHAVLKAAIMIITTYHHNACFNFQRGYYLQRSLKYAFYVQRKVLTFEMLVALYNNLQQPSMYLLFMFHCSNRTTICLIVFISLIIV